MLQRWTDRVVVVLLLSSSLFSCIAHGGSSNLGETTTSTIPRSTPTRRTFDSSSPQQQNQQHYYQQRPPWNPSPLIDEDGFLKCVYYRIPGEWEEEAQLTGKHGMKGTSSSSSSHHNTVTQRQKRWEQVPVTIRQVPGDGNCLFHSIAICWAHAVNGTHIRMKAVSGSSNPNVNTNNHNNKNNNNDDDDDDNDDSRWLYECSASLRQRAVDCLAGGQRLLFLQGKECLRAKDLVEAAASQYGLTGEEYCHLMRKDSYWGGGPEIVALVNVLRRPIHVYELCSTSGTSDSGGSSNAGGSNGRGGEGRFWLRRMACFGSPKFDRREPLHILSADSRFPDIEPGKQLASGNHFLAMFPNTHAAKTKKKQGVRGGNVDDHTDRPWWTNHRQHHLDEDDHIGSSSASHDNNDNDNDDEDKNLLQRWWERLTSLLEHVGF